MYRAEEWSDQTIQATESLVCSIKLLVQPAKIDGRVWRQGRLPSLEFFSLGTSVIQAPLNKPTSY